MCGEVSQEGGTELTSEYLKPKLFTPGGDFDSRARKHILSADGKLERMFCLSCGAPSGWVSAGDVNPNMAIYVCLNCVEKSGPPPLPRIGTID